MCYSPGDGAEEAPEFEKDDSATGGVDYEAVIFYDGRNVYNFLQNNEAPFAERNKVGKN